MLIPCVYWWLLCVHEMQLKTNSFGVISMEATICQFVFFEESSARFDQTVIFHDFWSRFHNSVLKKNIISYSWTYLYYIYWIYPICLSLLINKYCELYFVYLLRRIYHLYLYVAEVWNLHLNCFLRWLKQITNLFSYFWHQ